MDDLRQKLSLKAIEVSEKARARASLARKELDQKLLELTSMRFDKIRSLLAEKKQKWEAEGDIVYSMAEKVLKKAMAIRESMGSQQPDLASQSMDEKTNEEKTEIRAEMKPVESLDQGSEKATAMTSNPSSPKGKKKEIRSKLDAGKLTPGKGKVSTKAKKNAPSKKT